MALYGLGVGVAEVGFHLGGSLGYQGREATRFAGLLHVLGFARHMAGATWLCLPSVSPKGVLLGANGYYRSDHSPFPSPCRPFLPPLNLHAGGACFAVREEKGADGPCDRLSRQTARCRVHGGFRDHALSAVLDDALMGDRASGCRWPGLRASNAPPGSYSLDSSVAESRGPSVTDVAHVLCCVISSLSDRLPVHRCTRSCL
jgi:hypothetical protein